MTKPIDDILAPSANGATQIQPKALPWAFVAQTSLALKGRPNHVTIPHLSMTRNVFGIRPPFQGWRFLLLRDPKALPWANTGRPFGALAANSANSGSDGDMTKPIDDILAPSANGATQIQPKALPWVAHPQHPFSPERTTQPCHNPPLVYDEKCVWD